MFRLPNSLKLIVLAIQILNLPNIWGQQKSLSLTKCWQIIQEHPQVKTQLYAAENNKISERQLLSNRLPSLSANASQNLNFGRSIDPFTNQYIQNKIVSNNASLNTSIVLFNGLQNNYLISQSQHLYQANYYSSQKTANELAMSVANSYFSILMNQEQVKNLEIQIFNTTQQIEKTKLQIKSGTLSESNLLLLMAQQKTEQNNVIDLKSKILLTKNSLCQTLNIPLDTNLVLELGDTNIISTDLEQTGTFDPEKFPQIKENNERVKAAYYNYLATKGSLLPRLTLNAGITTLYSNQNKENFGSPKYKSTLTGFLNNDLSQPVYLPMSTYEKRTVAFGKQIDQNLSQFINLQLSIPIFANYTLQTNVKRAIINKNIAVAAKDLALNQLNHEYSQISINLNNSKHRYNNLKSQLVYSKNYFDIMNKRYESGISDLYGLLLEKNKIITLENDITRSKFEYIYYTKILNFYTNAQF